MSPAAFVQVKVQGHRVESKSSSHNGWEVKEIAKHDCGYYTMARMREPRSILVISPYKVLTSALMAEATEKLKQFQNIQFHN